MQTQIIEQTRSNRSTDKTADGISTRNASSSIPSVAESYKRMTTAIKVVLTLPGKKVKNGKTMEGFKKDFSTYLVVNMDNRIDIL